MPARVYLPAAPTLLGCPSSSRQPSIVCPHRPHFTLAAKPRRLTSPLDNFVTMSSDSSFKGSAARSSGDGSRASSKAMRTSVPLSAKVEAAMFHGSGSGLVESTPSVNLTTLAAVRVLGSLFLLRLGTLLQVLTLLWTRASTSRCQVQESPVDGMRAVQSIDVSIP